MRIIEIKAFTFEELNNEAKEKALDKVRANYEIAWNDENRNSIETFCAAFGVSLRDYQIGPYYGYNYETSTLENENFRGRKLREFSPDYMPTGYCLDCSLWGEFYAQFKRTGDSKYAFKQAIEQGFIDWQKDMEGQLEDESLIDYILGNGFEFTENGDPI